MFDTKPLPRLLYVTHSIISLFWFILFLIPTSFWHNRISFQFWYALGLVGVQYMWGTYQQKSFCSICPITTWQQEQRGYSRTDPLNYKHSFIHEMFNDFGISLSKKEIDIMLKVSFVLVIIQYIMWV